MPEANVLYSVTAVVVLGLVAWVAVVLKTAKEPWARPPIASLRTADVPLEGAAEAPVAEAKAEAKADADADAKADEKAADAEEKAEEKAEDAKAEEKAEEAADAKKTDDAAKA
jgi:cytoskeletal protein RodZ